MIRVVTLLFVVLFAFGCKNKADFSSIDKEKTMELPIGDYSIYYQYNNPDTTFLLPQDLVEISGLAYSDYSKMLITINDEKGDVHFINTNTGFRKSKIHFGSNDDYEGIAYHNDKIYITESNGNVKIIDEPSTGRIFINLSNNSKNPLSRKNNIEGLCYSPITNTMLLLAKGNNQIKGNVGNGKSVFSMDLSTAIIDNSPLFTMDVSEFVSNQQLLEPNNNYWKEKSIISSIYKFAPSGIAIHPKTFDFYILSSVASSICILDNNGSIMAYYLLDPNTNPQPEGITFDSQGTLYIANEGKNQKPKINKYLPLK
ncbi:MAG: SdiA-regulated domain-containing protein [Saprospiraceae bacterium]